MGVAMGAATAAPLVLFAGLVPGGKVQWLGDM